MNGAGWFVSATAATLFGAGCARAGALPPAASGRNAHEEASVALEYEVMRKGGDDGVVLQGRTSIDGRGEAEVKYAARERDKEELRLGAHERNDGTFDIEVRYREKSPDAEIAWEPVLRVARGASASADIKGVGWARTIRVKLE